MIDCLYRTADIKIYLCSATDVPYPADSSNSRLRILDWIRYVVYSNV
jgi:hypothetical protein